MRGKIHILISRLLQTCVVASLLAGCTKVVPDDSFEQKSRIGFNTAMTKAAVGIRKKANSSPQPTPLPVQAPGTMLPTGNGQLC